MCGSKPRLIKSCSAGRLFPLMLRPILWPLTRIDPPLLTRIDPLKRLLNSATVLVG